MDFDGTIGKRENETEYSVKIINFITFHNTRRPIDKITVKKCSRFVQREDPRGLRCKRLPKKMHLVRFSVLRNRVLLGANDLTNSFSVFLNFALSISFPRKPYKNEMISTLTNTPIPDKRYGSDQRWNRKHF